MELYGDPQMEQHKREREKFSGNLREIKNNQSSMGGLSAESLCYDLFEWFKNHIQTTDKRPGIFLKSKHAQ